MVNANPLYNSHISVFSTDFDINIYNNILYKLLKDYRCYNNNNGEH